MLPGEEMLIQRWEDWMQARDLSGETIRQYKYAMYRLQGETRPAKALVDMTQEDIITFLVSLGKRTAAKATYYRAFKSFFGWAYAQGDMERDITVGFRPKAPTEPPVDAFTQDEVAAILAAARARSEKRYYAILLCYALGLRRSELCGIRPEDVDWNTQRVYVKEAKGGRPRWVEANALAMAALEGLAAILPTFALTSRNGQAGDQHPEYSMPMLGYAPNWFTMIVNRAATEAGLPRGRRNAHMLRSSAATHMLGNGTPISVVSKILGHAQVSTTGRYLAVNDMDRRRALDTLVLPGLLPETA